MNELSAIELPNSSRITRDDNGVAYPRVVQLEVTSHCNAVCFFCAHTWSERPERNMDAALFARLIEEIRSWRIRVAQLYLTGLGEPLLHPHWREMFQLCRGLPGSFTTNCSLVDDEVVKFLFYLNFYELVFSLDTLNDTRHRAIRGFSVDKVAPVIEKVMTLGRRRSSNPRLIVSTTVTNETIGDMQEIYDWLVPLISGVTNASWVIKQVGHFPDVVKGAGHRLPPMTLTSELLSTLPDHPQVVIPHEEVALRPHCVLWYDRITVLSNGAVVPCCHQAHDHNRIGNVRHTTLLDLFNGQGWTDSQRRFDRRDGKDGWSTIPYCGDCR